MTLSPTVSAWVLRVLISIGIVICYVIFIIDMGRRATSDSKPLSNRKYQKWLNIWSKLIMFLCIINQTLFLCYTIPVICTYFSIILPISGYIRIFFTFYQITRLQYCFSQDYKKYIFILLYGNGILDFIFTSSIYNGVIATGIFVDQNGVQCHVYIKPEWQFIIPYHILWQLIYDIFVLIIYIKKVKYLQKHIVINSWNNAISHKKVTSLINKLLILTITRQIIAFLVSIPMGFVGSSLMIQSGFNVENVMSSIIMFLIVEHNHKIYGMVIKLLTKWKCCCLCKKMVYRTIEQFDVSNIETFATNEELQGLLSNIQTEMNTNTSQNKVSTIINSTCTSDIDLTLPSFRIHNRFVENSKQIYNELLSMDFNQHISQIISEFAATRFLNCIMCEQITFGGIECYHDYSILYGILANYSRNNELRFFLNINCDNGRKTVIDHNRSHFDIGKEIICSECAMNWKCSVCESLYLTSEYEDTFIIEEGCYQCGCIICDDCALYYRDRIYCGKCCNKQRKDYGDDESTVQSYKLYKSSQKSHKSSKWNINKFRYFDTSSRTKS
eukprot:115628_1